VSQEFETVWGERKHEKRRLQRARPSKAHTNASSASSSAPQRTQSGGATARGSNVAPETGDSKPAGTHSCASSDPTPMHLRPPRPDGKRCAICDSSADGASMLTCDVSGHVMHYDCVRDPPSRIPDGSSRPPTLNPKPQTLRASQTVALDPKTYTLNPSRIPDGNSRPPTMNTARVQNGDNYIGPKSFIKHPARIPGAYQTAHRLHTRDGSHTAP
jgi:hypothetical protein